MGSRRLDERKHVHIDPGQDLSRPEGLAEEPSDRRGIYALTADFPRQETFGLTSQMRRAAVAVPSNIAEGFGRRGRRDKARMLNIASASLEELRYQLILAADLGYLESGTLEAETAEVSRMLSSYERTILASAGD